MMAQQAKLTSELIALAYKIDDDEEYWKIISELHKRGSQIEFDAASKLSQSNDAIEREIGADIFGQLGYSKNKAFHNEAVEILIQLLDDKNTDVISSAAFSLGHRNDSRAIPYLVKQSGHNNPRVRYGVAFGLCGLDEIEAVNVLIALSHDQDFDVRNWATFGLGSQCYIDSVELRDALLERVSDAEYEIRGEALIGLAIRKDSRIHNAIIKELEGEFYGSWAVEAAQLMAHPAYCEVLNDLKRRLPTETEERFLHNIDEAILACSIKST